MNKRIIIAAVATSAVGLSLPAAADEIGAYVLAFGGQSSFETIDLDSIDDSDVTYGLALGYRLNPYFAAELSYVDLGAASYNPPDDVGAEVSAKGPAGSLLFFWPVHERVAPYLRAGITIMDTTAKVSGSSSESTSRSNLLYGVGADFTLTDRFGVRVEWTRYADVGSEDVTGEGNVDTIVAGVRFQF